MKIVKGPDFPTGALILGQGRDPRRVHDRVAAPSRCAPSPRSRRASKGEPRIVVTEVPYQTSVEVIGQKIAELVNDRKIEGIRDVRNESAGDTTRLVVELKRDANAQVVLNQLYKHTPMQTQLPGEHAGAGRRRAAAARPRPGARSSTSTTRSRSSAPHRVPPRARRRSGSTSSRAW